MKISQFINRSLVEYTHGRHGDNKPHFSYEVWKVLYWFRKSWLFLSCDRKAFYIYEILNIKALMCILIKTEGKPVPIWCFWGHGLWCAWGRTGWCIERESITTIYSIFCNIHVSFGCCRMHFLLILAKSVVQVSFFHLLYY
jgi:hypothetical protein